MPIATPAQYKEMLEAAQRGNYAYPAINVASLVAANAALKGFADAKSDGMIQVSTGGGKFASGLGVGSMVEGAISLAEHVHRMAAKYDILIALHTDHCPPDNVEDFMVPLIEESERRVAAGKPLLFNSHMLDASGLPLKENMDLSVPIFTRMAKIGQIIEVEAGVVGGEEDGAAGSDDTPADKLYTTPAEMVEVYRRMGEVDGIYMFAATFGNVHGAYKPGVVQLKPEILKDGQNAIKKEFGEDAHFHLVFHGGSGSEKAKIKETLNYGVIKMNVDTDTQYEFTRPIAEHMLENYESIIRSGDNMGDKKLYDPRGYMKKAEENMAKRVQQACEDLESAGKSICGGATCSMNEAKAS